MRLIVGLGNPGREYIETRHNVGFAVIDRLAERLEVAVTKTQGQVLIAKTQYAGEQVLLVKPQTYMNRSGLAVAALARYYKIPVSNIIVAYDDLDLPVGTIRLRAKGGAGTHNGMRSLIQELASEEFPRLRVGIGRPLEGDWANYVLSRFRREERDLIQEALEQGVAALLRYLEAGIDTAMNEFNKK